MSAPSSFSFPPFWHFPPYFTLQPVASTQAKQVELWEALVLRYAEWTQQVVIDVEELESSSRLSFAPFRNEGIQRELPLKARITIIDRMVSKGDAEWLSESPGGGSYGR